MIQNLWQTILHPTRKHSLLLLAVYTFGFAFMMPDWSTWLSDYWRLLTSQTYLMHDFTETAGMAAAFMNVGFHFVIAYYLMVRNTRSNLSGLQMAATGIFVGHSFFGTHLFNILPIILGVVLYSHWTGQSFKSYTAVSLFATAAGPFVSFLALAPGWTWFNLLIATAFGLGIGFISAPLAEQYLKFHHGFTLYNFGFAMGIIAMFATISFNYFNLDPTPQTYLNGDGHTILAWYVGLALLGLLAISWRGTSWDTYRRLLRSSGRTPDDFVSKFGYATTGLNMALTGFVFLLLLLAVGAQFNGPIVGGFCAIIGFASFGKHPANCLPIAIGVALAALLDGTALNQPQFLITLLFSTTLCPIAGYYGPLYGIIAGFLHFNLVTITFDLHQGMSLYNNGFASGFVAAFLVPIFDTFIDNHHAYD